MGTDIIAPEWSLPLIQTKMAPPHLPRGRVERMDLLGRLAAASERALTVVIAPAGFGKTTLLAEWHDHMRARGHLVGWLSLDEEDGDVQLFGAYVLGALTRSATGVGQHAQELLQKDPLTPVQTVMSVLFNEIAECDRQVFLVLDDFDRIDSPPVQAMVSRWIKYAPPNFHLVIGVRGEPALALSQFHAQEQLLTLNAADLRFSADDAQTFFSHSGLPVDRHSIELLTDAAEGWIAGLQLASLALRESGDVDRIANGLAEARNSVDAYLDDTVLSHLPAPMLQFLLRTSILDRLNGAVCDAIMGSGARSWEKLDWLERHNIFIRAQDREHTWFRYHALLSDALRRRLARQHPDEIQGLHRRASRWFAAEGMWPQAVRHALAGGELEQAADWVEDCAVQLMDRSDVRTLVGWLAKLPPELIRRRLRLRFAQAWTLALSMRIQEATAEIEALRNEVRAADSGAADTSPGQSTDIETEVKSVSALIAGFADESLRSLELGMAVAAPDRPAASWTNRFAHAALIFGLAYDGRFDEVRRLRELSAVHLGDGQVPLYADVYRESMSGVSALVEGALAEATQIFEGALRRAEAAVGRDSAAAALPAGYLAALYYDWNDLARTQEMLAGRAAIAFETCPLGSLLGHCRAAARLYARRGDRISALAILGKARELALARNWPRLRAGCDAEAVRILLTDGAIEQARALGEGLLAAMPRELPDHPGSMLETWASHRSLQARLLLAQGSPAEAAELLDALRNRLDGAGMRYLAARTEILRAHAQDEAGLQDEAMATLHGALQYGRLNRLVNTFVDEGEPVRKLLRHWRRSARPDDELAITYVDELLGTFAQHADGGGGLVAAPASPSSELLSAREIEILDHIARGLSNKEIGRALRVAPETIKWHLKNIFDKLNVSSRIEAVHRGLGLVRPGTTAPGTRPDDTPGKPAVR